MNEPLLKAWLAARYGIELEPADLARTAAIADAVLRDLEPYRDALDFHDEAASFEKVLEACAEART